MCTCIHVRDSFTCVTWLIHMWDMTHRRPWQVSWPTFAHVCHMTHLHASLDSFTCVTRLIHMRDMTHSHVWHDSFTCVTWLIYMRHLTHLHVWHDSFTYVTRLIHMCDMTHSHMWHDSFTCLTWQIHMCDLTHRRPLKVSWPTLARWSWLKTMSRLREMRDLTRSYVWHDSFVCVTWLVGMCDLTRWYVWHTLLVCVTRHTYGVATISRLLKVIGLFCRISSLL